MASSLVHKQNNCQLECLTEWFLYSCLQDVWPTRNMEGRCQAIQLSLMQYWKNGLIPASGESSASNDELQNILKQKKAHLRSKLSLCVT